MGDDGMLLNFELPPNAFAPKQTFKGGTWKDRLRAKKSATGRHRTADGRLAKTIPRFEEIHQDDEELILPGDRSNKRFKTGDAHSSKIPVGRDGEGFSAKASSIRKNLPKSTGGEVISSLFTYNPKSSTPQGNHEVIDDAPIEPSNAPLDDQLANFTTLGLSPILANHLLKKLEISAPTAIQKQTIQQLCNSGTDAFIQAETGSGKTLAYLLPILERLTRMSKLMKANGETFSRDSGLFAVILTPTRELSKQINVVLESLLICCPWIVGGTVIGGEKKKSEKARLRKGLSILVATPGRLADHLEHTEVLDVSTVRWLVLDEGDRLMELGFEQDIQKIVSILNLRNRKPLDRPIHGLPERRTTILCSATLKADIEQLKSIALKDAVSISIDPAQISESDHTAGVQTFSAPAQLRQSYATVPPKQRLVTLAATLKQTFRRKGSVMKCILFMSCADSVDFHFNVLTHEDDNIPKKAGSDEHATDSSNERPLDSPQNRTTSIPQGNTATSPRTFAQGTVVSSKQNPVQIFKLHGSLPQAVRTSTLKAFTKCSDPSVLVCTDVASRGLDLPDIDLVIEYDPPFSKDDHLHRVGRTARAGRDGRAMIFLMPGCEEGYIDILKEGRPRQLTRHDADDLLKKGFTATAGTVGNQDDWEGAATDWQLEVERWVLEHPRRLEQARRAFQSHVRAYATHVAAERSIFDMQQLHLGHLAKAFALRDKPGSLRVPGLRPNKEALTRTKEARREKAASSGRPLKDQDFDFPNVDYEASARKKMHAKMNSMGGASEFNLG